MLCYFHNRPQRKEVKTMRETLPDRALERGCWTPTEEQIELIAGRYNFSVILTKWRIYGRIHPWIPVYREIGGRCLYRHNVIICNDQKVAWHELGHAVIYLSLKKWGFRLLCQLISLQFPATIMLSVFGVCAPWWTACSSGFAVFCYILNELMADVIGLRLSRRWAGKV